MAADKRLTSLQLFGAKLAEFLPRGMEAKGFTFTPFFMMRVFCLE